MRAAVGGGVAPGFEAVEEEFRANFESRGELGAACAVCHDGRKVVDLWGGCRDAATGEPWEEDTMVLVFSTSKGVTAIATAVAHSRGLFDLDEPVATYWPQFAHNGKERVTVRQLLAYQAGLCAVDEPLDVGVLADLDRVADVVARQAPAWKPGTRHGYHALTLGFYQGELIRRVDPARRSLGAFLGDEVCRPLGCEFHIGLPDHVPARRVARIKAFHPLRMLLHLDTMPPLMVLSLLLPWSLTHRSMRNPRLRGPGAFDLERTRRVEFPSANGIGTARAIAAMYGDLATGGRRLGITRHTMAELIAPAREPSGGLVDKVCKLQTRYSFGFVRPCPGFSFGSSSASFGNPGAGGSFGFADPDARLGYAYVMNRMGFHIFDDPREKALRDACYRCLADL